MSFKEDFNNTASRVGKASLGDFNMLKHVLCYFGIFSFNHNIHNG